MTNIKKVFFLTAAAVVFCLCGFFMSEPEVNSEVGESKVEEFSKEKAENCLALSAAIYLKDSFSQYMENAGFDDYTFTEREQTPEYGSGVAFAISRKGNTVFTVIRGSVGCEWYSNFHIGEKESHAGFLSASEFVVGKIREYLRENRLEDKDVSLMITGHSRGGAVANLAAKEFIDSGDFDTVIAYTFASPNTTTSKAAHDYKYSSIYNIENPEDFICSIPPESWGFTKYGVTFSFPAYDTEEYYELYSRMQEKFFALAGYEHRGFERGSADTESFIDTLKELSPTVNDYYNRMLHTPMGDITMYEYMNKVATMLCGENTLRDGMFILTSATQGDFAPLAAFMLSGFEGGAPDQSNIMRSPVGCAHTPETYMAWLGVLNEENICFR